MLSEKQFRERARTELHQVAEQLKAIATDRAVYWKLEYDIVERNPDLRNARSAFLEMLRGCYVEAMTARLLRLLEPAAGETSLARLLQQLASYPELLHGRITESELVQDRDALQKAARTLRDTIIPRAGAHERTLTALTSTHRELDAATDLMLSIVKTCYWMVADGYIDMEPCPEEEPFAVFQSLWAVATVEK